MQVFRTIVPHLGLDMIAPTRGLVPLLAACLLSLPTTVLASSSPGMSATSATSATSGTSGTSACFGASMLYDAFTNRSRVVQISIVFVAAGYFFLKGNIRR
jgi:hypothetical protein